MPPGVRRRAVRRSWAGIVVAVALTGVRADALDPSVIVKDIDGAQLLTAKAVSVAPIALRIGPASIVLEEGTIVPVSPVAGRTMELVFVGTGHFRIAPDDPIEVQQLEMFTHQKALDEEFHAAVLAGLSDANTAQLLGGDPAGALDAETGKKIATLFQDWKSGPERRRLGVRESILREGVGDPAFVSFFAGWVRGAAVGDLLYEVDPESPKLVRLAHFQRTELTEAEKWRVRRALRGERRAGRLRALDLDLLGTYDLWMELPYQRADGKPIAGHPSFEGRRYLIDLTVEPGGEKIHAAATVTLESRTEGARTVQLALHSDLTVSRVTDGAGHPLSFSQYGGALVVCLAQGVPEFDSTTIVIEYAGAVFAALDDKKDLLVKLDTLLWHPFAGMEQRATYDVTLRWPKTLELIASGDVAEKGETETERWERHRLDRAGAGFLWEIGKYKTLTRKVGDGNITVALNRRAAAAYGDQDLEQLNKNVEDILTFFSKLWGPPPLNDLTVVVGEEGFGQAMLGFVTIPSGVLLHAEKFAIARGFSVYRVFMAHEIAHQWWGHRLSSAGAGDVWLNEALAEYASLLYGRYRLGREVKTNWVSPTKAWRDRLTEPTGWGRIVENTGPIVLGARLSSSRCQDCYDSIVYTKGAVALDMLGHLVGESKLAGILGQALKTFSGQRVTTDQFIGAIEQMSGVKLDWYVERYLRGTGIPMLYYSFKTTKLEEGAWQIDGTVEQEPSYWARFSVVRTSRGVLDARMRKIDVIDVTDSRLSMPVRVTFKEESKETFDQVAVTQVGRATPYFKKVPGHLYEEHVKQIQGVKSEFSLIVDKEPLKVRFDPEDTTLAWTRCQSCAPKNTLLQRAYSLLDGEKYAEAEALLKQALAAEYDDEGEPKEAAARIVRRRNSRNLDAEIYFLLTRMYADLDRENEAWSMLAKGKDLVDFDAPQWIKNEAVVQEARLQLRAGKPTVTYQMLWRDVSDDKNFLKAGHMLLAIAAHEVGEDRVYDRELKWCKDAGLDMSLLEDVHK